jgi:hypothetical protein
LQNTHIPHRFPYGRDKSGQWHCAGVPHSPLLSLWLQGNDIVNIG